GLAGIAAGIPEDDEVERVGLDSRDPPPARRHELDELAGVEVARVASGAELGEEVGGAGEARVRAERETSGVAEPARIERGAEDVEVARRAPDDGRAAGDHELDVGAGETDSVDQHGPLRQPAERVERVELS